MERSLDACLVVVYTAQTSIDYLVDSRFLVANRLELQADTFQLVDLERLQFINVDMPPAEKLAAVAMSPDATKLVAVTSAGEVWLYLIDRQRATASIVRRFDFGGVTSPTWAKTSILEGGAGAGTTLPVPLEVFSAAAFIDDDRLVVSPEVV